MNAIGSICACGRAVYHAGEKCARCHGRPEMEHKDRFGFALKIGMAVCLTSAIIAAVCGYTVE